MDLIETRKREEIKKQIEKQKKELNDIGDKIKKIEKDIEEMKVNVKRKNRYKRTSPAMDYVLTKYKSISAFARECGIETSNVRKNLLGDIKPDVKRVFLYANKMECDISKMLNLFYPDECKNNVNIIKQKAKEVKGND